MLCGRFGWNLPCRTEVENFQIFSIYFYYFAIISPWGRVWAFICKLPKMLCTKFGWNWPSSFKERILNIFNIILLLRFYLPFESGLALYLYKLESLHPRMLCAKFGWNWPRSSREDDFSNLLMYFRNFVIIPLGKGQKPSFEQIWIPCTQRWFLPSLVEIGSTVLENIFF